MSPKTVLVCTMVLQSIAWGASRPVPGFLKPMGAPRLGRFSWVDQRVSLDAHTELNDFAGHLITHN